MGVTPKEKAIQIIELCKPISPPYCKSHAITYCYGVIEHNTKLNEDKLKFWNDVISEIEKL